MADSKIAWTDKSWNPVVGCTKVSPGCDNCYAEKMAASGRLQQFHKYRQVIRSVGWNEKRKGDWIGWAFCDESALNKPLHWRKPRRIFVCSMGDLFHESVPFEFIDKVMAVIALCPQHIFQVLTKRPERMAEYYATDVYGRIIDFLNNGYIWDFDKPTISRAWKNARKDVWPLPNIWLGVTTENQSMADKRIPILLQIPAAVRFVSIEPMLGPVDITNKGMKNGYSRPTAFNSQCMPIEWTDPGDSYIGLDWVIVGAESGPKRRYCKPEWVDSIVVQCQAAGVPVFVKQIHTPSETGLPILIKDLENTGWPREYPKGGGNAK